MITTSTVVLVRTDRLGDVILTLPMARYLKEVLRVQKVVFVCRAYTAEIVKMCPFVDEVQVYTENAGEIFRSRDKEDTSVVFVTPEKRLTFAAFKAGIKNRIGTSRRWFSFLYNNRISIHRKPSTRHEAEYNFDLLHPFGGSLNDTLTTVQDVLSEDTGAAERMRTKLDTFFSGSVPDEYVILHPGSGGSSADLPVEKFKEIAGFILDNSRSHIIITGNPAESYLAEQIQSSHRISNMCGMFSLPELFSLYKGAAVFLSNSTGTLHLASAANVPVIGFFPKAITCSPVRWGPFTGKGTVFTPETDCTDCLVEDCRKKNCMAKINTAKVNLVVKKYLQSSNFLT